MSSLAKKVIPFVFVLSSVAVAAGLISKEAVNQKVADITAPYNSQNTKLDIKFTDLNVDAVRALDFGLKASVWKKSAVNELNLNLDNVQYHYGDGQNPTLTAAIALKLDLVAALGQDELNSASGELEKMAKDLAASYGQKYGDAILVDAKLVESNKDQKGNLVSAKLRVSAVIDFNKLPAGLKVEDVEFKNFAAEINIGRAGARGSVKLVMNPANSSFQQDQPGLKELIVKLLNEDAETYASVKGLADMLNGLADGLVNKTPQN